MTGAAERNLRLQQIITTQMETDIAQVKYLFGCKGLRTEIVGRPVMVVYSSKQVVLCTMLPLNSEILPIGKKKCTFPR